MLFFREIKFRDEVFRRVASPSPTPAAMSVNQVIFQFPIKFIVCVAFFLATPMESGKCRPPPRYNLCDIQMKNDVKYVKIAHVENI